MKFPCALLAFASLLPGQVFEGTVVNARSGEPVQGVSVTLSGAVGTAPKGSTDAQGFFRIEGLKAGSYTANFKHDDFLPPTPSARFQIGRGGDSVRLQIAMMPLSEVSGRVLDMEGQPVQGAEVLLDGARLGLTRTSDDQGNFSFDVAPGNYILSAQPRSETKPPATVPSTNGEQLNWAKTYYPSVLDPRGTVKITVRAGSDLSGQDIRLRTQAVRRLSGVVLDPRGDPVPRASVTAAAAGEVLAEDITVVAGDDGKFEFPALYDAEWRIASELPGNATVRAFAAVQIPGRDVEGVQLVLQMPFSVAGRVSFTGPGAPKFEKKLAVYLRPAVNGPDGRNQGVPGPDGAFTISDVHPGAYQIIVVPAPGPPYFLSSIRVGDLEVLGQYVEFHSGAIPIKIAYDSSGGSVRGAVEDCGDATVVLMPSERELQDPQFFQTAKCGEGGRFEFPTVRPGDYHALAFAQWDGPMELLSTLDQSLINKSVTARVSRGETANVDLRVIAPDR